MKSILAAIIIPASLGVVEIGAYAWMHPHRGASEIAAPSHESDDLKFPVRRASQEVSDILQTKDIETKVFQPTPKTAIQLHQIEWNKEKKVQPNHVLRHQPEICLGARGLKFQAHHKDQKFTVGDTELIFDSTEFIDHENTTLFVFKAPWIEGVPGLSLRQGVDGIDYEENKRSFRINAVKRRFKPRAARVFMLTAFGCTSAEEAWELCKSDVLKDFVIEHIKPS